MGVSKHYSLEFGLILDAVSIGVYSYHYHRTAEVVDTRGVDAELVYVAITIGILLKSWILPAGHGFHPMRLL